MNAGTYFEVSVRNPSLFSARVLIPGHDGFALCFLDPQVPSTIDMLGQWGYSPQAVYRKPQSLLQSLVRIVSKGRACLQLTKVCHESIYCRIGGNYLLNIGLNADGQWDRKGSFLFALSSFPAGNN